MWCGGRRDAESRAFLEDNGIGLIIAGVGQDTDPFLYGAEVEFGAHRLPIQFAGRERGGDTSSYAFA